MINKIENKLEELMIDCQDIQNLVAITEDLNYSIEEFQALKKEEIKEKISEQRTIVKSTQKNIVSLMDKLSQIIDEILKEKSQ